jgi:CheY-like chemotaxis protein
MSAALTSHAPPRRVLIVEDNPDGRETRRLLLGLWGHQVEAAADGAEGLRKGLAWQPDAAVVDLGLPLLDGFQVAHELRTRLGGRVLLIALTGLARPEDRRRAAQAGFDVHMPKPADLDVLQQLLAGASQSKDLA